MIKFWFSFLTCLLLIGCSKQPQLNQKTHEAWKIEEFLTFDNKFPAERGRASDTPYVLPTEAWIADFNQDFTQFLHKEGLKVTPQGYDCDDFTREAHALAVRKYYKSFHKLNSAILFGEISYVKTNGSSHTINFTIVENNTNLVVKYYEPQLQKIVQLTPEEKNTIFDWRF